MVNKIVTFRVKLVLIRHIFFGHRHDANHGIYLIPSILTAFDNGQDAVCKFYFYGLMIDLEVLVVLLLKAIGVEIR